MIICYESDLSAGRCGAAGIYRDVEQTLHQPGEYFRTTVKRFNGAFGGHTGYGRNGTTG